MKNGNEDMLPDMNEGENNASEATGKKARSRIGKYAQPFWLDLLAIIGVYVVTSLFAGIVSYIITRSTNADESLTVFIATVIQYPVVILFAIRLLRKRGRDYPPLSFSLRRSDPTMILWGLLVLTAMSIVVEPLASLLPVGNMDVMFKYILRGGVLTMFTVIILAPVLEEIFFRGIIQESTSRFYGPLVGIVIASAIFAIVHGNPQQIVSAFFSGLILGYIYYRTRSLIPVIIIHAINNAVAYILTHQFPDSVTLPLRQLIANDTWYWIIYGISVALLLIAAANLWSQLKKRDMKQTGAVK